MIRPRRRRVMPTARAHCGAATATGGNGIFAGTFNSGVNVNLDVRNSILRGSVNDIRAINNGSISSLSVG
ncbi:MAG TPA: hypothetical protein PKC20_02425, partial [Burkholderiaceae bacterium]|nr:hypothetical protein [Burkholderiaceae bacterium]